MTLPQAVENAANTAEVLLSAQDLEKSFGAVHAVRGCSFELHAGGIRGLIGPNGSGKSTLVNLLSGLQMPTGGAIKLGDQTITKWSPDRRANSGLVRTFQSARLWGQMSVAENLMVAAPARGRDSLLKTFFMRGRLEEAEAADRERASELLTRFNLWRLRGQRAHELSGGQARLLEFGRIMMSGARIALLDEPLAGVNPVMADQVVDGIETLSASGVTVLLIEHDLPTIRRLCSSVMGMSLGKIVMEGTIDELARTEVFAEAYLGASTRTGGTNV
ncbi:MAG: branched-chain amino acid transport system ATP-binding protein [Pseudonocardiales bacterium]|nr:branched-chain amino acid transport system ATP-binding protein [Pseudonocardiales bacterium]MDT5218351.1 branched-chain amino acid transport system ATP-binding protein [Mycobacterium sp.]